jgi:hypothetical protein
MPDGTMMYLIRFENVPEASAPTLRPERGRTSVRAERRADCPAGGGGRGGGVPGLSK